MVIQKIINHADIQQDNIASQSSLLRLLVFEFIDGWLLRSRHVFIIILVLQFITSEAVGSPFLLTTRRTFLSVTQTQPCQGQYTYLQAYGYIQHRCTELDSCIMDLWKQ